MHFKHGRYYFVRANKWHPLARDLHDALVEYAKLIAPKQQGGLDALVKRALEAMKKKIKPSTFKNYTTCSRRVLDAFAEFSPEQVRPVHIREFLDDNEDTPSMANLLRSFLKSMFELAVGWGIVDSNPVRDIKPFKTKGRDRYISADEFARIHKEAPPTLQCLMDLAYITGQRIGDVMNIHYSDITDEGLFVKQEKTGARVLIEMRPDLNAAIAQARAIHQSVKGMTLFHKRDGSPLAYNTIYGHWAKACKKANVGNANFHDIRAAAATDARKNGLDSKTLLGHTTDSSHERYQRSKEIKVAVPNDARKS